MTKPSQRERFNAKARVYARGRYREPSVWAMFAVSRAKFNAKKKGLTFNLTATDLLPPARCPVLGLRLVIGLGWRHPRAPSIDRVDNRKGYIPGNVRVISWRANRLKSDASAAELEAVARYMRKHNS